MVCENCGERPAVIHLTQVVGGTTTTMHLCEQCAAEKGVETGATLTKFPLSDFLASLGKAGDQPAGLESACPACGATLANFRETGRLGCAACYDTFEGHLRDLLRRLHGSAVHAGERYRARAVQVAGRTAERDDELEPEPTTTSRRLLELRAQLKQAVETENFELAAELRDRIRVLE